MLPGRLEAGPRPSSDATRERFVLRLGNRAANANGRACFVKPNIDPESHHNQKAE
jgi:hypothetical protein